MKSPGGAAWTAAALIAVSVHAAGVVAFADLLRQQPPQGKSELRLGDAKVLRSTPVAELAVGGSNATPASTGAAQAVAAHSNDTAVSESNAFREQAAVTAGRMLRGADDSKKVSAVQSTSAVPPTGSATTIAPASTGARQVVAARSNGTAVSESDAAKNQAAVIADRMLRGADDSMHVSGVQSVSAVPPAIPVGS